MKETEKFDKYFVLSIGMVLAIFTLCSTTSPLYAFCDESHCFFSVGKAILNGRVLYRDIVEQKGLLIYAMQIPAYLLSHTNFFGVWIIQSILMSITAVYQYKFFEELNLGKRMAFVGVCVSAVVIFTSPSIASGQLVEVYMMPAFAYALYSIVHYMEKEDGIPYSALFVNGILAGVAFWSKYTLCGFWFGMTAVICIHSLLRADLKKALLQGITVLAGMALVSVPCVLYFYFNNSVQDMVALYFSNNISSYGEKTTMYGLLRGYVKAGFYHIRWSPVLFCTLALGAGWVVFGEWKMETKASVVAGLAVLYAVVFVHGPMFIYYLFSFATFAVLGVGFVLRMLKIYTLTHVVPAWLKKWSVSLVVLGSLGVSILMLPYPNQFLKDGSDLAQFQFANYMHEKSDNPTMLDYMYLDGGFYTVADIVPNTWAYCGLNWENPQMVEDQLTTMREGKVQFVVTRELADGSDNLRLPPELTENYEFVQAITQCRVDTMFKYTLYQQKT